MTKNWIRSSLVAALVAFSPQVKAETADPVPDNPRDRALWEVGVVAGGLYLPDYPAARQKHIKWAAAPYAVYRGKILRADREGARARLVRSSWADVEMSFAASFATDSEDNDARRGMPDLDYLGEAGPRVSLLLSRLGGRGRLRFFLPVRAVFSTDFGDFRHRGYTASPALYMNLQPFLRPGWIGVVHLAGRFANRQMNAYFYDVKGLYALPTRPAYDARAGYLGSDLLAGMVIPLGERWRVFTGGQLYAMHGSANSASPLYLRRFDYSVGMALGYTIYRSRKPAEL